MENGKIKMDIVLIVANYYPAGNYVGFLKIMFLENKKWYIINIWFNKCNILIILLFCFEIKKNFNVFNSLLINSILVYLC